MIILLVNIDKYTTFQVYEIRHLADSFLL